MRTTLNTALALLLAGLLVAPGVTAKEKEGEKKKSAETQTERAPRAYSSRVPVPGDCEIGRSERDLDVNNVLARAFTTGSVGYGNSSEAAYLVPRASGNSPIYASGVWVGGLVDGEIHTAAATYSNFEFWPGPLDATGNVVGGDCSAYDRIYKVSRSDIQAFEATGVAAPDLAAWPAALGAPVIAALDNGVDDDQDGLVDEGTDGLDNDGDGFVDERDEQERRVDGNFDLGAGDRPEIVGDQALWWVMNDVGNVHNNTSSPPLGIEVQVLAWAFNRADALGDATFFRYRIINKSGSNIENTYLSIFSDPDLGDAGDDLVGADTTLSLGFVYNADAVDATYGVPPAAGYDFFQGPIVDGDTLGLTSFMYFINGVDPPLADPDNREEVYFIQQGRWTDGTPLTVGGNGFQSGGPVTQFAFAGDPVTGEYWSEVNADGNGTQNAGGDRRFVMSTGPFTLEAGDSQDIVYGIVFAQGNDRLNSIDALRAADELAQTAYDIDFELAPPAPAPPLCDRNSTLLVPGSGNCLEAVELEGEVALTWGYPSVSENYLGSYEVLDRLLAGTDVDDDTYNFEGFNIYRYPNANFAIDQRELIATFDKDNNITQVYDTTLNAAGDRVPTLNEATRLADNSGIQYSLRLPGSFTNYTDYYYGITTYSYNANSVPKVIESAATNLVIRPTAADARNDGSQVRASSGQVLQANPRVQRGEGEVLATVVNPAAITGDTYTVRFFETEDGQTTYSIFNAQDTSDVIVSGEEYFERTGEALPVGDNVIAGRGLSFTIISPSGPLFFDPDADDPETLTNLAFVEVQGPGGVDPCAEDATSRGGCDVDPINANLVYQSINSTGQFVGFNTGDHSYGTGPEGVIGRYAPNDYEIRFTEEGSYAYYPFTTGRLIRVPFEVWDVGVVVPGTENDPSDDVQMIPNLFSDAGSDEAGECDFDFVADTIFGVGLVSQRIYAYYAAGDDYAAFAAAAEAALAADDNGCVDDPASGPAGDLIDFGRGRPLQRYVLEDWTAGAQDIDTDLTGSIIRFYTTNPSLPGDEFDVETGDISVLQDVEIAREAMDRIAAVPNPYYGRSDYETGRLDRRMRFTNLPAQATLRIYTISGTLIRTLTKDGPGLSLDWDLETENNLPVASGMYLVHVEGRTSDGADLGERVLKVGVINRRTQVNVF